MIIMMKATTTMMIMMMNCRSRIGLRCGNLLEAVAEAKVGGGGGRHTEKKKEDADKGAEGKKSSVN